MASTLAQHNADIRRAAYFFSQRHWKRLLDAIYNKYIAQGRVGGQVILHDCTPDELREIARFLGKRLPTNAEITVRLSDFQQALLTSSFTCTLPELLAESFPQRPLRTRPEQRAQQVAARQRFHDALSNLYATLPADSPAANWLQEGPHGLESLFQRYKNKASDIQQQLLQQLEIITRSLNQLPEPPQYERLSLFSQRLSGDPHFLDSKTQAGRLFVQALSDLYQRAHAAEGVYAPAADVSGAIPETATEAPEAVTAVVDETEGVDAFSPEQEHQQLLYYYEAGLLLDTISSTVAVFHLAAAADHAGQRDPLVEHAGARVLSLPLRQLLAWQRLDPVSEHVYLFENPQVFERVVDDLLQERDLLRVNDPVQGRDLTTQQLPAQRLPTLICTAGWPSVAAIRLLNLITEAHPDVILHYSGDFDVAGLRIAAYLCTLYRQCQPWHFDVSSYQAALHSHANIPLTNAELAMLEGLPTTFTLLVTALRAQRQKAYQEAITQQLLADIL